MTRVLRSALKRCQSKEDLSSKLSISKKPKTLKRRTNKVKKTKNEDIQQSDVWNISSILSNIFAYTDHRDLLKFNTVCKKWNHVSNPIIHKTIKLNRSWDILKQTYDKKFTAAAKVDADVIECISNNTKHSHFVNKFNYSYRLEPQRAIEVFETFRFIINLTVESCGMSQDQFLRMIKPLTQLQELNLSNLSIKKITYKRLYKEVLQLPSSLKKLNLHHVSLIDSPDLFVQTINSHSNLIEFNYSSSYDNEFLEPFYKPYPSLVSFNYANQKQKSPQLLINIFEHNPQIAILKLNLSCWNSELTSYISGYLINLEELNLSETLYYYDEYTEMFLKFSQPTKIKKLNLGWTRLSNCSLDSILLNCPHLEDLALNRYNCYQRPNSEIFINLHKSVKLKKLNIDCENLSGSIVNSLLSSCRHLNELVISLPFEWKEAIKLIYEKCENLQSLEIKPSNSMYGQERDNFFQEFCEIELFTSNSKCKSTLTHLTLNRFDPQDSRAEQFEKFEQLKSIKYPTQRYSNYRKPHEKFEIDMDLWPGYKLVTKDNRFDYDVELKKILV